MTLRLASFCGSARFRESLYARVPWSRGGSVFVCALFVCSVYCVCAPACVYAHARVRCVCLGTWVPLANGWFYRG